MRTEHHRQAKVSKNLFKAPPSEIRPPRLTAPRFKVTKPYEGFHVGQVVYQYQGPTFGIECAGEVPITVVPNKAPFVGLPSDFLEKVAG